MFRGRLQDEHLELILDRIDAPRVKTYLNESEVLLWTSDADHYP